MTNHSKTARLKRIGLTTIAGFGLFAGAAGIASAANGHAATPSTPPAVVAPVAHASPTDTPEAGDTSDVKGVDTPEAGDTADAKGVDCQDGLIAATGASCDGGPSANQANDPNEPAGVETANA